jgi:hypothetical protein
VHVRLGDVHADQRAARGVDRDQAPGAPARRVLEADLGDHAEVEELTDEGGDRREAEACGRCQLLPGGG